MAEDHPNKDQSYNELLFQAFEWNLPSNKRHWVELRTRIEELKKLGVTSMWIPPACKPMNPSGNGYDVYDLYDIGEFPQKGSIDTKWGSLTELKRLVDMAQEANIRILWDAVLNHRAGADKMEKCRAVPVDSKDRTHNLTEPIELQAWLGFEYKGRGNQYSSMAYHWNHFSGIDQNINSDLPMIYKIIGDGNKDWAQDVSHEFGNYDYLMFADVDYSSQEVRNDVKNWVKWLQEQLPIGGLRLDAAKHYSRTFQLELIRYVQSSIDPAWLFIAEYWHTDASILTDYVKQMEQSVSVFDIPLVQNISRASQEKGADLRAIFKNTMASVQPESAVTFVMNHDTQPGRDLDRPVEPWFKPLAYALILLSENKGLPCVFYGDLYGMYDKESKNLETPPVPHLDFLALARRLYAYGPQRGSLTNFERSCIAFIRPGNDDHPFGLVCIMSRGGRNAKYIHVGRKHAGEIWTEIYGDYPKSVTINAFGGGIFWVQPRSVSVFVNSKATGRDLFPSKAILAMNSSRVTPSGGPQ